MEKQKKKAGKKIIITVFAIGCVTCVLSIACNKFTKNENTSVNAVAARETAYNTNIDFKQTLSDDDVIYTNNYELGISFSLPSSWDGLYTCENDNGCVSYYHADIHAKNGKGLLFTLYKSTTSILETKNNPYSSLENFKILDTVDDNNVFISYPSTADSVVEEYVQEYNTMLNDINKVVLPSVHFTK